MKARLVSGRETLSARMADPIVDSPFVYGLWTMRVNYIALRLYIPVHAYLRATR